MLLALVACILFVGLGALVALVVAGGELDDALLASGEARTLGLDFLH
ncbi:MAG: hypothetical protein WBA53_08635 [Burkholderiaceae bacterium]